MPIYTRNMPCWTDLQVWQKVKDVGGFGPGDKMVEGVQWVDTDHGMCRAAVTELEGIGAGPPLRKVVAFKTLRGKFHVRSLFNGAINPTLDELKALDAEKRLREPPPTDGDYDYDGGP